MIYEVLTMNSPDWEKAGKAEITSYSWGCEYKPPSYGQLIKINGMGLAVRMISFEAEPKTVYSSYNDPVFKDSCLEFFASFNSSPLYMNFEVNSKAAFLSAVRKERKNKTPIHELININDISIPPIKEKDFWGFEAVFTFDVINRLFGECSFDQGQSFKGNFYKCGDETAIPHFGSWSPINTLSPDFHRPEFFGEFIIK